MSDDKPRVLIVDDSVTDLRLLVDCLQQNFQVVAAKSGEEALEILSASKIDVVVLDIDMPGIGGYETCRRMRLINKHLQILFLSANDGLGEILLGYDAGGSDYIVKPFNADILLSKITFAVESADQYERLEAEKNDASGAFMTAVSSLGDMGGVINFLRGSFQVKTSDDLAELLFECLDSYNLQACIQLRSTFGDVNYASALELSPLEVELLNRIAVTEERFVENGRRLFVNFPKVSVLIKNIPINNPLKLGRMRDTLAILVEATDEKQRSIEKDQTLLGVLQRGHNENTRLFAEMEAAIVFIKNAHQELKYSHINLVENMLDKIQQAFPELYISDAAEARLNEILQNCKFGAAQLFKENEILEEQIEAILHKISVKH